MTTHQIQQRSKGRETVKAASAGDLEVTFDICITGWILGSLVLLESDRIDEDFETLEI